jgi:hypothetical protein
MTFLQICQRLRSEAGIAGTGPTSTANQLGELGRIVDWVQDAYVDIQEKHDQWGFMRAGFTLPIVIGTALYPATSIPGLMAWLKPKDCDGLRCYLGSTADEQWLRYRPYDEFRGLRLMAAMRDATGRPTEYTVTPNNGLLLWPIPDNTYTIDGEYVQAAVKFVNDADIPVFADFHMVILWCALMKYAAYSAEPSLYAHAQKEYGRLVNKLELKYLPSITLGGAWA